MAIEIDFTEKDIEDYLCEPGNLMKHLGLRFVARQVEFINSCHFTIDNNTQFAQPYAYMWDSSTDTGAPERVVQNASWPGVSMTKLNKKKSNLDVYAFYYNSIFDRIIFNDDYNPSSAAYQTHDLNLDQAKTNPQFYVGKVFDMATLKWYNNFNSLPTYSDYSVRGEFFTSDDQNRWTVSRMVVNPNNSNELYCRVYVRYQSSGSTYYRFKIMKNDQSEWWGYGHDNTDVDKNITDDKDRIRVSCNHKCISVISLTGDLME